MTDEKQLQDGEDQPVTEAIVFQVETLMAELGERGHTTKWAIGRDSSGDRCIIFMVDGAKEFKYPVSFFAGYADAGTIVNAEHEANVIEADMVKGADSEEAEVEFRAEARQEAEAETADAEEETKGSVHLIDLVDLCELYGRLGSSVQEQLRQLVETGPGDQNPNACSLMIPWFKSVNLTFMCKDAGFLVDDVIGAIDDANYVIEADKAKEEHVTGGE